MTFQKSSFDKPRRVFWGIFLSTVRKNMVITGIYSLLLFIFLPLSALYSGLMSSQSAAPIELASSQVAVRSAIPVSTAVTGVGLSLIIILPFLFCIITALILFNYLHNKKATDLYHSLPISRTSLFFSKYLAGLSMIFVPLTVIMGITAFIQSLLSKPEINLLISLDSFSIIAVFILTMVCIYTMTVFIAVNTGTVLDAVITFLVLNIGWVILVASFQGLLQNLLFGFSPDNSYYIYLIFSPISALFMTFSFLTYGSTGQIIYIAIFTAVSVLALSGSVLIYKKRKSDYSGRAFSYHYMKNIIRIIASLAAGTAAAVSLSIQHSTTGKAVIAFASGFIIVSFVTYLLIYAVSSRGFKGFLKSLTIYGTTAAVIALIYCTVGFDVFGYQTAVPKLSDIKNISVSSYSYMPNNENMYYSEESIKAFLNLHTEISDWIKNNDRPPFVFGRSRMIGDSGPYSQYGNTQIYGNPQKRYDSTVQQTYDFENQITLSYHLKNGSSLTRSYTIGNETFRNALDAIYSLQEYKSNKNLLFSIKPSQIFLASIADDYSDSVISLSKEQSIEIINTLRKEYRISTGFNANPYKNPACTILFNSTLNDYNGIVPANGFSGQYYNCEYQFAIYPYYINTIKLIEKYTGKSYSSFPDGTKAVLCNYLTPGLWDGFDYNMAKNYDVLNFNIVSDSDKLQKLRDSTVRYCNAEYMNSGFFLQYYYPDGTRSQLFYCWGNDVPLFYSGLNFTRLSYNDVKNFIS